MTFRIDKIAGSQGSTIYHFAGNIGLEQLEALYDLVKRERQQALFLDLKDVTLVDRAVVIFLMAWEKDGAQLRNCPAYIRKWIEGISLQGGSGL